MIESQRGNKNSLRSLANDQGNLINEHEMCKIFQEYFRTSFRKDTKCRRDLIFSPVCRVSRGRMGNAVKE